MSTGDAVTESDVIGPELIDPDSSAVTSTVKPEGVVWTNAAGQVVAIVEDIE